MCEKAPILDVLTFTVTEPIKSAAMSRTGVYVISGMLIAAGLAISTMVHVTMLAIIPVALALWALTATTTVVAVLMRRPKQQPQQAAPHITVVQCEHQPTIQARHVGATYEEVTTRGQSQLPAPSPAAPTVDGLLPRGWTATKEHP